MGTGHRFGSEDDNMLKIVCIAAVLVCALAQRGAPPPDEVPKPFQYEYSERVGKDGEPGGVISASANADGTGKQEGRYTIEINDLKRIVQWIADKEGFRANIQSNEPGFKDDSPADAVYTFLRRRK